MKTKLILFITLVMSLVVINNAVAIDPLPPTADVLDSLYFECIHEKLTPHKSGIPIIVATEIYGYIDGFSDSCPEYIENSPPNIALPAEERSYVIWEGKEGEWGIDIPFDAPKPVYVESPHNPTCRFGLNPVNF